MAGLAGIKEIAQHMRRSENTVLKWHREYGLPMCKIGGTWESDTDLIDSWRRDLVRSQANGGGDNRSFEE